MQNEKIRCLLLHRENKNIFWWRVVGWVDILLDVIGGVESALQEGCPRVMTGVYKRWCSSTLHIGWGLCDSLCLVLVCRGRYCLGGVFLLFILGSNLG
jgi:hypothetical protein